MRRYSLGPRGLNAMATTGLVLLSTACAAPSLPGVVAAPAPLPSPSVATVSSDGAPSHDGWAFLGSARLDSVIAHAWQRHPSIDAATAAVRQAEESAAARLGATQWPQADVGLGTQRQRFNPAVLGQNTPPREFSLVSASVNVRYTFDLFGGDRAVGQSLRHRADGRRFELEGARAALGAAISNAAVNQAWQRALLDTWIRLEQLETERLTMLRSQQALGTASADAVATQERAQHDVSVTRSRQALVLAEAGNRLAMLTGATAADQNDVSFVLRDFAVTSRVADSIASSLVLTRPDVRAADAYMRATHAEYAAAVVRAYPRLQLTASTASQVLAGGSLFGPGSAVYSLLSQLTQPLFQRGQAAERRAALAGFEGAFAQYEYVVLDAWRSVRDLLAAQAQHAHAIESLTLREASARAAFERVARQVALGGASRWQLLNAEYARESATLALRQEQLHQITDRIAWYQAVPGAYSAGF
ncbi:TolC family protein [Gemmatimonas sp.]